MKAIIGRKIGMTQVFTTTGEMIPVTVVEALPNVVLQKKTIEKDGYEALKVGYEDKRATLANKPEQGQYKAANATPKKFIREIKGDELKGYDVGDVVNPSIFKAGELVDVQGTSKGKGFSGVIKRFGYHRGPSAHGSGYHRGIGSIATYGLTNNRIHPGIGMAGHHGNFTRTVQNLTVVAVDDAKHVILIKGAIPGANKGVVTVKSATKTTKHIPPAPTLVDYGAAHE